MRVIAGSLKGRRLKAPTWPGVRPTSDKLRETLFNVLAARVPGARVLDGFAGTGAIGIEALSRGAAHVTFVERDRRAQALIAENLAHCGITAGYAMMRAAFDRVELLRGGPGFVPFDLVFLDPPYEAAAGDVLRRAAAVVARHGLLVLEHARRRPAPEAVECLGRVRQVVSGDSALSFYEVTGPENPSSTA